MSKKNPEPGKETQGFVINDKFKLLVPAATNFEIIENEQREKEIVESRKSFLENISGFVERDKQENKRKKLKELNDNYFLIVDLISEILPKMTDKESQYWLECQIKRIRINFPDENYDEIPVFFELQQPPDMTISVITEHPIFYPKEVLVKALLTLFTVNLESVNKERAERAKGIQEQDQAPETDQKEKPEYYEYFHSIGNGKWEIKGITKKVFIESYAIVKGFPGSALITNMIEEGIFIFKGSFDGMKVTSRTIIMESIKPNKQVIKEIKSILEKAL